MNIKLKLKRPKNPKSVIFTEFYYKGVYYRFYTGKTVNTENWSKKGQVKSGEENAELINLFLKNWADELCKIFAEFEANKKGLIKEEIQAKLDNVFNPTIQSVNEDNNSSDNVTNDFTSFMEEFIELKRSDGKFLQKLEQAQKSFLIAFKLISAKDLKAYNALSNKQKSKVLLKAEYKMPFKEVNLKMIQRYKDYLNKATYTTKEGGKEIERHFTMNYIDKQINGLKQFINGAIEAKYVEHFTWDSVKSNGNEVDSVHTDFEEIQIIHDLPLNKPNEIKIRDKYVINCFLGFRYSDLNKLEPHVFKKTVIKGVQYLVYSGRNQKTGELVEFVVHPIAAALLEKYNYQIPKYSAKEFNDIIKIVAEKAGLKQLCRIREIRAGKTTLMDIPKYELISSHTGRRSFCTNFYVEGIATAIIMSISGHKTEKEFMKYIKKRSVRLEVAAEQISAIKGINHLRVA